MGLAFALERLSVQIQTPHLAPMAGQRPSLGPYCWSARMRFLRPASTADQTRRLQMQAFRTHYQHRQALKADQRVMAFDPKQKPRQRAKLTGLDLTPVQMLK